MNSDLSRQQEAFKKSLRNQPIIVKAQQARTDDVSKEVQESLRIEDSTTIRHINSYLHSIISYLKIANGAVSFEEIRDKLNIDLEDNEDLMDRITSNPKIERRGRSLIYKHEFSVRSTEELLELLQERSRVAGINLQELKEACPSIDSIAQELIQADKIIAIKGKDESNKILFLNLAKTHPVDEQLKTIWDGIKIPFQQDLENSLAKAGVKCFSSEKLDATESQHASLQSRKKPARKFNRRIKITNTHIEGLDFTQDLQ